MTTRLKGRQMDYLGDVPAFLQDMKDGELRVTDQGVFVRYGPRISKIDVDEIAVSTTTTTTTTTTTSTSSFTTSTSSASSTSTTTTAPPAWFPIHSPLYWEDAGELVPLLWDAFNTRWEAGGGGNDAGLQPVGTWSVGLRPSDMRMNYGPSHEVTIKDTNGGTIGYSPLYTSGDPIPLTFGSFDIGEIVFHNVDSNLVITNIEFLLLGYSTTTTTTTSSTTTTHPPFKAFHFDEFDDASIDPAWDNQGFSNNGGAITEQNDRIELLLNPRGKASSQLWIEQTGIQGFGAVPGVNQNFNIYGKLRIPPLSELIKDSSGEPIWTHADMDFSGGGANDRMYIQLYWTGTQIDLRWYATDGVNGNSGTAAAAITQNEIWFKFEWQTKWSQISMQYSLVDPFLGLGWNGIGTGKAVPNPGAHTDLKFQIRSSSSDSGKSILTWCEYVRDYSLYTFASINRGSLGGEIGRNAEPTWDDARNTADAETAGPPWGVPYGYLAQVTYDGKVYNLDRSLLEFDLSGIPDGATIVAASIRFQYGGPAFGLTSTLMAQEANFGGTFEVGDYDSFFGPDLGHLTITSNNWDETMVLNNDGIAAIQNNLADNLLQICLREFYYDFSGPAPGANSYRIHYEYDNPIILKVVYTV